MNNGGITSTINPILARCGVAFSLVVPMAAPAQHAAVAKVCTPAHNWFQCAENVKKTIEATNNTNVAFAAAAEWADRYDALYMANAQQTWPSSDQEMFQKTMEKLYDEALGKYVDPAGLAFSLALAKYLPRLAAYVEFAGSTVVNTACS